MAVITPGLDRGIRTFNGAGKGPAGLDLSASIFFNAGRGVPRYEDLLTIRIFSQTHTISVPLDTIKGQVTTTEWSIVPTVDTPTSKHAAACDAITDFLDGGFNANPSTFDGLCKEWLNDILSIDAGVLELVPGDDGALAEIYPRDGATFTKNLDRQGRLPAPGSDEPAYWQVGAQVGVLQDSTLWNRGGLPQMDRLMQQNAYLALSGMLGYRAIDPVPFSRDQVVWVEENPQTWRPYGYSRIQKVQRLVEILINQDVSNLKYFPANEVPEGALNLVEANQAEIDRFREYWNAEIAGKPHKMPILGAKNLQWLPFRASPRELEFLASQEWYNGLVWMAFGLAPSEVGYVQDVNRSTAQEMTEAVWRKTTLPLLELLKSAINRSILPYLEVYWDVAGEIEFIWNPHNPVIERQKRLEQENDLRHGLTTPNRVLQARGEKPVPWGDMPTTLFESLCRTQPEWVAGEVLGMENAPEPLYGGGMFLSASSSPVQKALDDLRKGRAEEEPPEWRPRIEALHRKVGALFEEELVKLRPAIEQAFPAEEGENRRPVVDVQAIADQIELTDPLLAITRDATADAMQHAADREAARLEQILGERIGGKHVVRLRYRQGEAWTKDIDITQTVAFRLLRQHAAQNMRSVEESVREQVRNTLARVMEEGGNVTTAWQALRDTIDGITADHARLVARTEILQAARHGSQALGEQAKDLVDKVWKSRKAPGRTRPWHAVMDGTTIPVDEEFEVPQLGAKGQPKNYPVRTLVVGGDQPFNCMCDQRLIPKEDLPTDVGEMRSIGCLVIVTDRQAEVLDKHGHPGESLRDLLVRTDAGMSKNATADALGISKTTLYEWRKQESLDT